MNKSPSSLLNAPTAKRLSSNRLKKESSPTKEVSNIPSLSRRFLPSKPENSNEFDVIFEEVCLLNT